MQYIPLKVSCAFHWKVPVSLPYPIQSSLIQWWKIIMEATISWVVTLCQLDVCLQSSNFPKSSFCSLGRVVTFFSLGLSKLPQIIESVNGGGSLQPSYLWYSSMTGKTFVWQKACDMDSYDFSRLALLGCGAKREPAIGGPAFASGLSLLWPDSLVASSVQVHFSK